MYFVVPGARFTWVLDATSFAVFWFQVWWAGWWKEGGSPNEVNASRGETWWGDVKACYLPQTQMLVRLPQEPASIVGAGKLFGWFSYSGYTLKNSWCAIRYGGRCLHVFYGYCHNSLKLLFCFWGSCQDSLLTKYPAFLEVAILWIQYLCMYLISSGCKALQEQLLPGIL